ncbi:MAG: bifunctional phosphoribosyl-AMP cyclohydrolase/phosphoribosyl-ATP diphosphatase HisIE [Lachnospiraceae bacterium]|nr:bifunctional phosphoribosyl-AMP cyclohydrolase/phosphoribosyl-ATP diphosphatase HisIE [Lachnospiraceae bacterium]
MKNRELIAPVFLKDGKVLHTPEVTEETEEAITDVSSFASSCENFGADAFLIFDLSNFDAEHDQSIGLIKKISRATDLPLYGGGNIRRMEDVKKLLYAGCKKVFLNFSKESNVMLAKEASDRFGRGRLMACVETDEEYALAVSHAAYLEGLLVRGCMLSDHRSVGNNMSEIDAGFRQRTGSDMDSAVSAPADIWEDIYLEMDEYETDAAAAALLEGAATGIFCKTFSGKEFPFMEEKYALVQRGISTNIFESSLAWEDIKTGSDGLLPVVVQDYRTLEVLMVAYMNEEAYRTTIRTGRMTYWSRSRRELWVKGLTSGHFQYVKELAIDCDNDTLLAKVAQIGAACHTGHRSCFYRPILQKEYDSTNPMKVFEEVFAVIEDRKVHPKEGSYTNYLFDKGIDKILKKVGEEAAEIIIAAKNPDPEEVVYEISDFLYHVMVLMSERGLTWEDITRELAKR